MEDLIILKKVNTFESVSIVIYFFVWSAVLFDAVLQSSSPR